MTFINQTLWVMFVDNIFMFMGNICLHTVKWFQVFLANTNNSI